MSRDTDRDWNALAELDPYWAVQTHDEFAGLSRRVRRRAASPFLSPRAAAPSSDWMWPTACRRVRELSEQLGVRNVPFVKADDDLTQAHGTFDLVQVAEVTGEMQQRRNGGRTLQCFLRVISVSPC